MTNCFDRYAWKPKLCKRAKSLYNLLEKWGFLSKSIASVHVIGHSSTFWWGDSLPEVQEILTRAGIPSNEAWESPLRENVRLPRAVKLYEPVVFVFEDGNTLELRLAPNGGIFVSKNCISPDISDGLSLSNFDSAAFFAPLVGVKLKRVIFRRIRKEAEGAPDDYGPKIIESVEWIFGTNQQRSIILSGDSSPYFNEYKMELFPIIIRFGELKKLATPREEILIKDAFVRNINMQIMPVRLVYENGKYQECDYAEEHAISLQEDSVCRYLYPFLTRHYDTDFVYPPEVREEENDGFDTHWNNFFSYERMRRIVSDIRDGIVLLQTDYDSEEAREIWKYYSVDIYAPDPDEKKITRENIHVVIRFYEQFCYRMEKMMELAPDYQFIDFGNRY